MRPKRRHRGRLSRPVYDGQIANLGEDQKDSLRVIVAHMIEETARHAGHADILREQIDGATGL